MFTEQFGDSGEFAATYPIQQVRKLEPLKIALPEVTYRDVRFQMEYPELFIYKQPPFTVASDESYFNVEHAVKTLQALHTRFLRVFGPLARTRTGETIQVLFLSDQEQFELSAT